MVFKIFLLVKEANLSYKKRWELGFELDDMLIGCRFNQKQCNSTWFKPFIDYNYGTCFIFNSELGNRTLKTAEIQKSKINIQQKVKFY